MKVSGIRHRYLIFVASFACLFFFALATSYFAFTIEDEDSWYHFRLLCHRVVQVIRLPSYATLLRNFIYHPVAQLAWGSGVYAALITTIISILRIR